MNRELRFILRFRSDAARVLGRVGKQFRALGVQTNLVSQGLKRVTTGFVAVGAAARAAGARIATAFRGLPALFSKLRGGLVGITALLATFGVGIGLGATLTTLAQFEFQLARVQAISGATGQAFQALSERARELGATTFFTATEAAKGLELLSLAGFTVSESIAAVGASLDLAISGNLDLASATDITANVLRSFTIQASDAARVADVLTVTSTNSNTTVRELGEALKFVGPAAASLGVELEQAAAAAGVLSDAGLKATLAGTGLRRVLIGLVNVTPKGEKALNRLGLTGDQVREVLQGDGGLIEAVDLLAERNLGAAEAFELFGLRGGPAAIVLTRFNDRLEELNQTTQEAEGAAARVAEIVGDTLVGSIKQARSAFEELILGQTAVAAGAREIVDNFTGVFRALAGINDPLDENAADFERVADRVREFFGALTTIGGFFVDVIIPTVENTAAIISELSRAFNFLTRDVEGTGNTLRQTLGRAFFGAFIPLPPLVRETTIEVAELNETLRRTAVVLGQVDELVLDSLQQIQQAQGLTGEALVEVGGIFESRFSRLSRFVVRLNSELNQTEAQIKAVGGDEALEERARALRTELNLATAALGQLANVVNDFRSTRDVLEREATALQRFTNEAQEAGEALNAAIAAAGSIDEIEGTISDLEFDIAQVRLGPGQEADIQRKINEALRSAQLDVEIPEALADERRAREQRIEVLKEELATRENLIEAERVGIMDQIAANQDSIRQIDENVAARGRLRDQLVEGVRALEEERIAVKDREQADKDAAKARERLIELQEDFRASLRAAKVDLDAEREAIGASSRELELLAFRRDLEREAAAAGLTDQKAAIDALVAQKAALEDLKRTDFGAALRAEFQNFADSAIDARNIVQQGFSTFAQGATNEIVSFATTGEFSFRRFAASVLQSLAQIGAQLIIVGTLRRFAFGAGGGLGGLFGGLGSTASQGAAAFGGATSGVFTAGFAEGGRAESPPKVLVVPRRKFRNPTRYQFGGEAGTDTIPALLSPGERVLTRSQTAAFEAGRTAPGGGMTVNVNISTPDVAGFQRSKSQVETQLAEAVRRAQERSL